MQIGLMVAPERRIGVSGIIVTVCRQRVGGDEIPFRKSLGDFQVEARCKMLLQVNIVFSTPLYAPL